MALLRMAALSALLPLSLAVSLAPIARPFVVTDLVGTWTRYVAFPGSETLCPKTIEHAAYSSEADGSASIPHTAIKHNGVACTGSGAMRVLNISDALKVPDIETSFNSDPTGNVKTAVDNVVKGSDSLVGFEDKARSCGKEPGIVEKGGFLMIHEDEKDVTLIPRLAILTKGPRYLAYFAPPGSDGKFVGCLYRNEDPPSTKPPSTLAASTTKPTVSGATTATKDNPTCFPAAATAERRDGSLVAMSDLAIGDVVKVGPARFSPVFAFTHADPRATAAFVAIRTASGAELRLTPGHYLRVNGGLAAAGAVVPGDAVQLGDGRTDRVVGLSHPVLDGLYNPQTLDGEIVVDGVLASTYTTAVEPVAAHAALMPLRTLFRALGVAPLSLAKGAYSVAAGLPSGAVYA